MAILLEHQNSFNTLRRIITRFQGNFSVSLTRCNNLVLRSAILKELEQELSGKYAVLELDPKTQSLHQSIVAFFGEQQPKALMVIGLESIIELESLLAGANWKRDEIKRGLHCPLILWVTDTVLYEFNKAAPDLRSWTTPPIKFC